MPDAEQRLTTEALRVYRRYQREFVEAFGVCPWAERARRDGNVREIVITSAEPDERASLDALAELADDERVHIGLLIYPRSTLSRVEHERFVAELRDADARRWPPGGVPMASAAFHPDAPIDLDAPARLVPFLRRTPDPTIQLVRRSILDHVRRGSDHGTGFVDPRMLDPAVLAEPVKEALHERVATSNLETMRGLGVAEAARVLADIKRDRDESYARLSTEVARSR